MHNKFTAITEKDRDWFIAYCPEVPGANGQGRTIEECKTNLTAAISFILENRREDRLYGLLGNAICEVIINYKL
jgi:predicted RNase H-like HicB family nuclease